MTDERPHIRLLRAVLGTRGWSQRWLAWELGVSRRTLVRWLADETDPHPAIVDRARVLLDAAPALDGVRTSLPGGLSDGGSPPPVGP